MRNNLLVIFILSAIFVNAQNRCSYIPPKEAENLIFPPSIGITANKDGISVFTPGNIMDQGNGSAAISDADGNLLFSTNGMTVWNKNNTVMSGGAGLNGNFGASQSAVIIPKPNNEEIYYIFTTSIIDGLPVTYSNDHGFNYHVVDMSKNGGLGAMKTVNRNLLEHVAQKVAATKHANESDYWVFTHGWKNNTFYSYKVTSTGLSAVNSQNIGSEYNYLTGETALSKNTVGYMKFSPDGSKLALAIRGLGKVEIFDFNNETGVLSNYVVVDIADAYCVEFSPNNKFLYVTSVGNQSNEHDNMLLQVRLSDLNVRNLSESLLDEEKDATSLQLTVGRQIIVTGHGKESIGLIYNPDREECNFIHNAITVNAAIGINGTTNFCSSFLDIPPFLYDTKCLNDETLFEIINSSNTTDITWDFDDPDSGAANNISDEAPIHVFSKVGDFDVSLTLKDASGDEYVYHRVVTIDALPEPDLGATKYLLPNATTVLDPGEFYSYSWQLSASEERTEIVGEEGTYTVEVENERCCKESADVDVVIVKLSIPNAFKPSSSIPENQKFTINDNIDGINNYTLYVYNKWGQQVFVSNDISNSWDGTYNGKECASGAYAYLLSFSIMDEQQNTKEITKKGQVILVR